MKNQLIATIQLSSAGCNTLLKLQVLLCLGINDDRTIEQLNKVIQRSTSGVHNCLTDMELAKLVTSKEIYTGNRPALVFSATPKAKDLLAPFKTIPADELAALARC